MSALLLFLAASAVQGQTSETPSQSTKAPPPATETARSDGDTRSDSEPAEVIIRVAEDLFAPLVNKPFDVSQPVDRVIEGTHVVGRCRTTGKTSIDIDNSRKNAAFELTVRGQSHSRTTGHHPPAIIYNRAVTSFVATKRITFDGEKFIAGRTRIRASTNLVREGVSSTLPGLRGAVVRAVARRRTAQMHGRSEAISSHLTSQSVVQEVDSRVNEELDKLNSRLATQKVLERMLGLASNEAWTWRVTSSEHFLEIHLVLGQNAKPRLAPPKNMPMQHTIEVYVHGSVFHEDGSQIVRVWGPLAKPLGAAARNSTAILSAAFDRNQRKWLNSVGLDTRDAWVVVELGEPLSRQDSRPPRPAPPTNAEVSPAELQASDQAGGRQLR